MPIQSNTTFSERKGDGTPIQLSRTDAPTEIPSRQDTVINQGGENPKGGDSVVKILIWVVVVVLVAVVIYLLINNLTGTPETTTPPAPPPVVEDDTLDPIVAEKNPTSEAESAPKATDYSTDAQSVGSQSSDTFTIEEYSVESYVDFFRFVFPVTSDGTAKFPLTEATYADNEITLTFHGVSTDDSGLEEGKSQPVVSSVVTGLIHETALDETLSTYTITLSEEAGYFLHLLEEPNRIIIDVKEPAAEEEEETPPAEEEEEDTTDESEKPTVKTLTNEFALTPQWIVSDVTGNVVQTTKYQFQDFGSYVRITYDLSGGVPNVAAELKVDGDDNYLEVVVSNRVTRNATSTVEINHGNVKTMEVVTAGNSSTHKIHLNKASQYRIYATESPMQLMIEVKD